VAGGLDKTKAREKKKKKSEKLFLLSLKDRMRVVEIIPYRERANLRVKYGNFEKSKNQDKKNHLEGKSKCDRCRGEKPPCSGNLMSSRPRAKKPPIKRGRISGNIKGRREITFR